MKKDEKKESSSSFLDRLNNLKAETKKRTSFDNYFNGLSKAFFNYVLKEHDKDKAKKDKEIVDMFGMFLSMKTDINKIEEVTPKMASKDFPKWFKINSFEALHFISDKQTKECLHAFFSFLADEKNIVNENVLKALK